MRVHYQRTDNTYTGWGVYAWNGPTTPSAGWPGSPRWAFDQTDSYGRYVDITVDPTKGKMDFVINKPTGATTADKDPDCDRVITFSASIATLGQEIWLKQGDCRVFTSLDATTSLAMAHARAVWLAAGTMVWPNQTASGNSYKLYYAANGGIEVRASGVVGADLAFDLTPGTLPADLQTKFRAKALGLPLNVPQAARDQIKTLMKGQLVAVRFAGTTPAEATHLQIQGVLDEAYAAAANQTLGVSFAGDGTPTFRLWAPTAQAVELKIAGGATTPMTLDAATGVWSLTGDKALTNSAYYTYSVRAWDWRSKAVVTSEVVDPYALTLNANSRAAMVADISAATFKPTGWDAHAIPPLASNADVVLYELHARDFSANDSTVSAANRGKYLAFTESGSNGMQHLRRLAQAGLSHVHLLPLNDIASVNESGCTTPTIPAATSATDTGPQAAVAAAKDADCFNWGYDPRSYAAPEGSYASDAADGAVRVREFRAMVQGLHAAGLRVVIDVVYNHTAGSFLDRIVPGYYYRLNGDGYIENSTCCENTAPEFMMMEKLMIDTAVIWARDYKIDGLRFDIMGHIPKSGIVRLQTAVNAAAGRPLYYYGEAWNFGEVANDRLFDQARQANLAGTGVGSFSDRIRDAIRGGGPFDTGTAMVRNQGFASGQCYDVNASATCDAANAAYWQDIIRLGLAGSVRDFTLNGKLARDYDYGGQQAGFTQDPIEVINYAGVHDGETLWDMSQFKHPTATTSAERARAQVVALGTVLMGQGIPFIHAGDELLRSKSMDRDSYNAGDWFNRIDWTAGTNYWGEMGLPSAEKNQDNWTLIGTYLANTAIKPSGAEIAAARDAFIDLLKVRKDTSMFRLGTGADVKACVSFPDQGSASQTGLVVMRIAGTKAGGGNCGDGKYQAIYVLINAHKNASSFSHAAAVGRTLALHPVQAAGADARVKTATFSAGTGTFTVPGRTVAVFVQ
ncbi:MAG TPA: alpha-1,6-glucosidase domain-containing protein [Burkholderiaceae bacterium]|nr:alpha-1,6-glucosidase domain-containing protein [Burkholderiaceae bacterium]